MLLLASSGCGLFKWRQFEPEVILLGGLVSALFTFVSRRGGVARRAGFARRARHGVAISSSGTRPELHRCLRRHLKLTEMLAHGREVRPGERQVALPLKRQQSWKKFLVPL